MRERALGPTQHRRPSDDHPDADLDSTRSNACAASFRQMTQPRGIGRDRSAREYRPSVRRTRGVVYSLLKESQTFLPHEILRVGHRP